MIAEAITLADVLADASNMAPPEAALHYAENGIAVFPCDPDTKAPFVSGGFKSAVTDPAQVREWWNKWPAAMIGSPTGQSFDVFDLDGTEGRSNFARLCWDHGDPDTLSRAQTETPGCGLHIYTEPVDNLKGTASKLAPKVDTRAGGSYVIMPGSIRADGKAYTFTAGDFTKAPEWLVSECRDRGLMKGTPSTSAPPVASYAAPCDFPPGIPPTIRDLIESGTGEGNRNGSAFEIACQLRDEGLPESEALALVESFAARCNPPLPISEAGTVTRSAYAKAPREPARDPRKEPPQSMDPAALVQTLKGTVEAELPPELPGELWEADPVPLGGVHGEAESLPINELPGAVGDMVEAVRETYRQPSDLIAACALGVLSIATRNRFKVEMKRDHWTNTNLYVMVAAPPGTGKSPVLKSIQTPLAEWQNEARSAWQKLFADWRRKASLTESRVKGILRTMEKGGNGFDMMTAQDQIAELEDELGPSPAPPCAFTTDVTSEELARLMAGNSGNAAVLTSEGRKILSIAKGRYVEGGDIDLWLAGHAGDYCRIDRRGSEHVEIPHPTLSALVLTQPDSLCQLGESPALRESGFLARWLYIYPEASPSPYNVESVPEATARAWSELVRRIMEFKPAQGANGEPLPHLIKMSSEALQMWKAFHDEVGREIVQNRETMPLTIQSWESKLPDHVARIAGLLRIVRHIENGDDLNTLTAGDVQAAIRFVPALRSHVLRAVQCMGANTETTRARKVWTWIEKNRDRLTDTRNAEGLGRIEAVKPRDIERAGVAGIKNATEAAAVLDLLASKGWLQLMTFKKAKTTARHQALYFLRPSIYCGQSANV